MLLQKLILVQDKENPEWRQNTIIFMDRAAYCKNKETKQFLNYK